MCEFLSDLDEFIGGIVWNDSSEPPEKEEADEASKDARGVGYLKNKQNKKMTLFPLPQTTVSGQSLNRLTMI